MKRRLAVRPKRIIVKVGSGVLTARDYRLNQAWIKDLVGQICVVCQQDIEVILVTSGAIGAGLGLLNLKSRPRLLPQQQAAAAVGQGQLMKIYDNFFRQHNLRTAQLLLTREDLDNRKRYLNAKNTLFTLLGYKAIPIVNENDTVAVDEIKFGDNDRLSALVANLIQADLLIILSDVDGLYVRAPKRNEPKRQRKVISVVEKITPEVEQIAKATGSALGTGGMSSKIEAAKICCAAGISCVVANGHTPDIIRRILDGQDIGTLFIPKRQGLVAKKRWIGFSAKIKGEIVVDGGAKLALTVRKKSLLAKGVLKIKGDFVSGDTVSIRDQRTGEFARGLVNYSAEELAKIKGQNSERIRAILGYKYYDEVVHRDNLAVL